MGKQYFRLVGAVIVSALLLVGVQLLAHFPSGENPEHGVLRLAWRMAGERIKLCRQQTAAELAATPMHMRRPEVCRDHLLSYQLRVSVNGAAQVDHVFRPPGAKGDRPLFIHQELPLAPGTYQLVVTFSPTETAEEIVQQLAATSPEEQARVRQSLAAAARPVLEQAITIKAGRVVWLDVDESTRAFVMRGG